MQLTFATPLQRVLLFCIVLVDAVGCVLRLSLIHSLGNNTSCGTSHLKCCSSSACKDMRSLKLVCIRIHWYTDHTGAWICEQRHYGTQKIWSHRQTRYAHNFICVISSMENYTCYFKTENHAQENFEQFPGQWEPIYSFHFHKMDY